ncbi:glycosyltransferase family 2 protein [Patescibacteria group bacterium]|nr:glycosyltransferase family 2 protein [Patescibacteria group bacterium]
MRQKNPLVSVSVLTYNGLEYLNYCLNSVFSQSYPNLEIIVLDNNSTDGTIDWLKKLKPRENLRIILSPENLGFAKGHNRNIGESRGEFILCLNQDAVLDRNFIQNAVETFKRDEKIGTIQGKLYRWQIGMPASQNSREYHVSRIIDTTGLKILKNRRIINREQGQIDQGQFEKTEEIFGADGAAPIYRRKALEDVKILNEYFDEDFFCYKEDVDLAWRLWLYGWTAVYQPKAVAWHDRTTGDSAAINYFSIIRERIKINKFGKYLAFKNQRLTQIKNEQISLLIRHLPWLLAKEIASWIYVILFERYTWKAIRDLFRQTPSAWQKRKIIMSKKRVSAGEMEKWFK